MKKGKDLNKLYRELKRYNNSVNELNKAMNDLNPGLMAQVNASKGANVNKLTFKMLDNLLDDLNKS